MPAQLVPTVKTFYEIPDMIKGFVEGWKKQFGEFPQKKSIAIIYAQWAIETGQGKSCWNNNIGNVKYSPSKISSNDDHIKYMMLSNVWEIINGKKIIYNPPHKATWFRSFDSLSDGVAFHLDVLKNKRYKSAWSAIEMGSPVDFAHLLKVANYYTAPESDYVRAIALYFNKFMKDDTFEKVIASLVAPEPTTIIEHVETIDPKTDPTPAQVSFWKSTVQLFSNVFTKK